MNAAIGVSTTASASRTNRETVGIQAVATSRCIDMTAAPCLRRLHKSHAHTYCWQRPKRGCKKYGRGRWTIKHQETKQSSGRLFPSLRLRNLSHSRLKLVCKLHGFDFGQSGSRRKSG